ncbi:MAG: DUF177 domain-containing protein [Pseudomonadota bacterium]
MQKFEEPFSYVVGLNADQIGRDLLLNASNSDLTDIAKRLDISRVHSVSAKVCLRSKGQNNNIDEVIVDGTIDALLTRTCVATLEPFEEKIKTPFRVRLTRSLSEDDIQSDEDVDVLTGQTIDIGDLVIQQIAVAMAAYPRIEKASISTAGLKSDENTENSVESGAFSSLRSLLAKPESS